MENPAQENRSIFNSISFKISFFVILIMFASLIVISAVFVISDRLKISNDIVKNGTVFASSTIDGIYTNYVQYYTHPQPEAFQSFKALTQQTMSNNQDIVGVSMAAVNGKILFNSDEFKTGKGTGLREITDAELLRILSEEKISSRVIQQANGTQVTQIVVPLSEAGGGHILSMIYLVSNNSLNQRMNEVYSQIALTVIPIMLLVILLTIPYTLAFTRPVVKLTRAAEKLRAGDFDVQVEIKSKDEIGALASTFNQMAAKLKGYYGELENKVKERTQELEKAKIDLEHSLADATSLQQAVKEERDRARAIVASMGEGLFVLDKNMKIILINPTAERLLEVNGQGIIGRDIKDIVVKILKNGQEIAVSGRPSARTLAGASIIAGIEDNIVFKLASGKEFPVALATTPLRGDGITGVVEVFRDITSEKQSRGAIEQQVVERTKELQEKNSALTSAKEEISRGWLQIQMEKARLLASVNSITLGFLMLDAAGKTLIKNPAVEKSIGLKSDYANIDSMDQLLGNAFALKAKFNKCVEERTPTDIKDINFNNRFFHLFMAPIFSTDNTLTVIGVVILIQDETEEKVMARSKDEFFSIASHELRTPLTAIRGNTSMIQQYFSVDLAAKPDLKEMIDDVHDSSVRLIQIVNDFLNVSRLEQGKMEYKIENFDLVQLIGKKIEEVNSIAVPKGLQIKFDKPVGALPSAYSDKDRVGEVLLNLLGNAVKYSDKGVITVQAFLLQGYLKVSVTDTGRGIPVEQQSLLFRKFQQAGKSLLTRDTTQATGLGLYISKLITEQMGGQIFLEKSAPGIGSTFSFTIPIQQVNSGAQIPMYTGVGSSANQPQ